jgi:hypothetical protein
MNYYNSNEKKSSSDEDDARFTLGNCFAATFNETQSISDKLTDAKGEVKAKLNDTMLVYFDYLLKLYERLDTAMINDLKGQKIDRPYFAYNKNIGFLFIIMSTNHANYFILLTFKCYTSNTSGGSTHWSNF